MTSDRLRSFVPWVLLAALAVAGNPGAARAQQDPVVAKFFSRGEQNLAPEGVSESARAYVEGLSGGDRRSLARALTRDDDPRMRRYGVELLVAAGQEGDAVLGIVKLIVDGQDVAELFYRWHTTLTPEVLERINAGVEQKLRMLIDEFDREGRKRAEYYLQDVFATNIDSKRRGEEQPERGTWPVLAEHKGFRIEPRYPSPQVNARIASAGKALLRSAETSEYQILDATNGKLSGISVGTERVPADLVSMTPEGELLYRVPEGSYDKFLWWYGDVSRTDRLRVAPPPGFHPEDGDPLLARNGEWIAWPERHKANGVPAFRIWLLSMKGQAPRVVTPALPAPAGEPLRLRLQDVDMQAETIWLEREGALHAVDLEGTPRGEAVGPGDGQDWSYCHTEDGGWVAWRSGVGRLDPHLVRWKLGGHEGELELDWFTNIYTVAVSPDQRWIALTQRTSQPNRGLTALRVLRASDGAEVFRRNFSQYARPVANFVGPGQLAFDPGDETPSIRVVALPSP